MPKKENYKKSFAGREAWMKRKKEDRPKQTWKDGKWTKS